MTEASALLVIVSPEGGNPSSWPTFIGTILLLLANSSVGFYEEYKAGGTVRALVDSLTPMAKVLRDRKWSEIESSNLVPGDTVALKIGNIVTADFRLTDVAETLIDQALSEI